MEGRETYQFIFSFHGSFKEMEALARALKGKKQVPSPVTVKRVVDKITTNELQYI